MATLALLVLVACLVPLGAAATLNDWSVQIETTVAKNPPAITLRWAVDDRATSYEICRKLRTDPSWGSGRVQDSLYAPLADYANWRQPI